MPNSIKHSTTGDTQSLRKGNFFFGVGDVGKGPSSSSGHYNGVTPMSGGYTIYSYNVNETSKISFHTANSDFELISYTNIISGQGFTTAVQCLNWYATQTNYACVNKNYEGIITDGLVFNVDAGFIPSYPTNGTTSYDLSYDGNNGTLVNGTPYSSLDGGYFMFDGTDDYINVGVGKSCNGFTGDFAVSAWVNRSPNGITWGNIIGDYYTNNTFNPLEWQIMISNTAQLFVYNVTSGYVINPINSGFNTDSWINVVLSRIGSTISLYANSNTITTATNGTTFGSPTGNINIGVDGNNSAEALNGKIANVLIYKDRGLTSSEVLQNYNAGLARFNTANIVKNNLVLNLDSTSSVSYPTTGTAWKDLSGYGNTGTLINGPTFNSTTKSIVFDGSDDYVNCGSNSSLDIPRTVTMELLFKVTGFGSPWTNVFGKMNADGDSSTRCYTAFINSSGYVHFVTADSSGQEHLDSTNFINSEVWYHWVGTVNRNTGVLSQYVNGTLNSVGSVRTTDIVTNSDPLRVGYAGSYYQRYNGSVAVARIYNKSLSTSEILQNYYGSPIITDGLIMALDAGNLVSYPGSGTTWKDLTTNGTNGTLTNGTTFNSSNGGSIVFDGTDDYMVVPTFSNKPTTAITCESWIKPTKPTVSGTIRGGAISSSNSMYLGIIDSTDGGNTFSMHWANQTNNSRVSNWNGSIPNNSWSYLVGTYDGTMARAYLNGVEIWSTPQTGTIPDATYYVGTYGGSVVDGTHNFNGHIPIARIYNRALTPQEISQNYNAAKSRFGL